MKKILLGMVLGVLLAGAAGLLFLNSGMFPMGADNPPGGLEKFAARSLVHAWLRSAPQTENPIPVSDANLTEAGKLYKNNCEGCHGTLKGGENLFASALNPPVPQFFDDAPEDDPDGELFQITKSGIRMTGMPACGKMLKDDEIWKVVLFVKNFKKIPPAVAAAIEK